MRKILIIVQMMIAAAVIIPFSANANATFHKRVKKEKSDVHKKNQQNDTWASLEIKQQFNFDFPNATNPSWKRDFFNEVTFNNGGITEKAFYDDNNELVGTTRNASFSELPEKAKKEITERYPAYKVDQIILYEDNPDNDTELRLYSTPFENHDNYFVVISNGNQEKILRAEKDGEVSIFRNF